jgi:hypothetical protein
LPLGMLSEEKLEAGLVLWYVRGFCYVLKASEFEKFVAV